MRLNWPLVASHSRTLLGRTEGLERIVGYILPENYVMQLICRKLPKQGFEVKYERSHDSRQRSNYGVPVDSWLRAILTRVIRAFPIGEKPAFLVNL